MIRIAPISVFDVSAQQAWLEDMAVKGWFLRDYTSGVFSLASFTKGEPKAVRYRLEPAAPGETFPDTERREVYRQLGWEHVTTVGKELYVWRCDDPDAPELHTEPETEAGAYTHLSRKLWMWNGIALALMGLALALLLGCFLGPGDWYCRQVKSWQPAGAWWAAWAALAFALWQCGRESLMLRRFLRTLRAGVPVAHRRPYRASRVLAGVMAVSYITMLALQLGNLFQPSSRPFQPLTDFSQPVPCVAMTEPENVMALRWQNWRTSQQWWTIEDQGDLICEGRYFRLRLSGQAKRLTESILMDHREREWSVEKLEVPGLDEAWRTDTGDGCQFLTLRLGKQVWDLSYQGGDLTARLGESAAILAERQQRGE